MPKRDQKGRGGGRNGNSRKRRKNRTPAKGTSPKAIPVNTNQNLDLEYLEKLWAKEFLNKRKDERERLMNELHGVSSREVPESPEMIAFAMASFQEEVDRVVPESEKSAYYRACSMNSTYVQSVSFRLKFLRAELFDHKKAALRYVRNLDYLLEKFGDFALMRQLYLSDLNREEKRFLKKGYMQVLPFRDNVGRRIVGNLGSYGGFNFSMETKERVGAYLNFAILADDITSQRKGVVSLGLLSEDAIECIQSVKLSNMNRFIQAMPIRYSGFHTCLSNSFRSKVIKALTLTFVQGDARLMSRVHIGTQIECDYSLRTFGIHTEYIPRSSTGKIKDGQLKAFLKVRLVMDNQRKAEARGDYHRYYSSTFIISPFPAIECPEVDSFLIRRNGSAWNYPGNIRVRDFLEEKLSDRPRLDEEYMRSIAEEMMVRNIPILEFDYIHCWYTRVTRRDHIQKQVLYIMREIRKRKRIKTNCSLQSNMCETHSFQGLTNERCRVMNSCCNVTNDEVLSREIHK